MTPKKYEKVFDTKLLDLAAFEFATEILLADGGALVEFLLTSGEGDVQLGITVIGYVAAGSDDGKTLVLYGQSQVSQFFFSKQKLSVTNRVVSTPRCPEIGGDIHSLHVEFSVYKIAEGVLQGGLAGTDRFNLRSYQRDSGVVLLQKFVIETGSLIINLNFAFSFGHNVQN